MAVELLTNLVAAESNSTGLTLTVQSQYMQKQQHLLRVKEMRELKMKKGL